MSEVKFSSMEEAINQFARGEYVVVMDDEDRENEGDIVMAAQFVTPEKITFALRHTSGILCAPLTVDHAERLQLPPMVAKGNDPNGTAFTVTVDHINTTTGVSSVDRSTTFKALAAPKSVASDFTRPGHIFPLVARRGGILERRGHTEATLELCLLSGLEPVGLLAEIMNEDGTMSRLLDCVEFAKKYELPIITVEQLAAYRTQLKTENKEDTSVENNKYKVELAATCTLPISRNGIFLGKWNTQLFYSPSDGVTHTVISKGDYKKEIEEGRSVLTRVHSECFTGNTLGSLRCDCGEQLDLSMLAVNEYGTGVIIYVGGHEGRGIGLINKVKAYNLQDEESIDTYEANHRLGFAKDLREYECVKSILEMLGINKLNLMTNNKWKYQAFNGMIEKISPLVGKTTPHNSKYLEAKRKEHGVFAEREHPIRLL